MKLIDADTIDVKIYESIMDIIEAEQTFDISVKKARWVPVEMTIFNRKTYKCSLCRKRLNFKGVEQDTANYCPNCGAVMLNPSPN